MHAFIFFIFFFFCSLFWRQRKLLESLERWIAIISEHLSQFDSSEKMQHLKAQRAFKGGGGGGEREREKERERERERETHSL